MRRIAAAIAAITLIAGTAHAQGHGGGNGRATAAAAARPRPVRKAAATATATPTTATVVAAATTDRRWPNRCAAMTSAATGMRCARRTAIPIVATATAAAGAMPDVARATTTASPGNNDRGNRGNDRAIANDNRGRGNDNRTVVVDRGRGNDDRTVVIDDRRGRGRDVDVIHVRDFERLGPRGLINGCPPGLAKKNPPAFRQAWRAAATATTTTSVAS
jgi:pimeloyl-ACP methyl ester carboxylesterase